MSLISLLGYLEKRPKMYIRDKKIKLLESFIGGYFLCLSEHNLIKEHDLLFRDNFYNWIYNKYELDRGISWADLVIQLSQKNKKNEFDLFFELLKGFKKEKEIPDAV